MFIDTSYGYHSFRPLRYVANCFTSLHRRLLIKSFTCRQNMNQSIISLRKQTNILQCYHCFPRLMHFRNNGKNAILMVCQYPDLGCASDWLKWISLVAWPIRSPTRIWVVTSHQYVLVLQHHFAGKPAQCCRFLRLVHYEMLWEGCTDKLIHWDYGWWGPNSMMSKEASEQSWTI